MTAPNPILWTPAPERAAATRMAAFMARHGLSDYAAAHAWSVTERAAFWEAVAAFCDVQWHSAPTHVLEEPDGIRSARWFSGGTLNYAEHLLRHEFDGPALIEWVEDGRRRELSLPDLRQAVADCAAGLKAAGVVPGDRVAGFVPNCIEAVIAMLAATSLGAVWTSCSPDFGASAVIDRFGQTQPTVLFTAEGYRYNGKEIGCWATVRELVAAVPSIQTVVYFEFAGVAATGARAERAVPLSAFSIPGSALQFTPLPFDAPLFVMYSSGTTGAPKCIVHGVGGTLLQHLKEHVLHTDIHPGDRLFYFTTCGWMMWNWLASGLAAGATLVLFDGAPVAGDGRALWRMAEAERVSVFGTSARYIAEIERAGLRPRDEFDLHALKAVLSTGSPLAPASFDYVYDAIHPDVQLSSISGGTDILSCFALGNPVLPVRKGELQCRGLGMAVQVVDDDGAAVTDVAGELICTEAFPSMPIYFWNDADGRRYTGAYFERFDGVWAHGDLAKVHSHGGVEILGRSDAVLNPGGVRIGTAEIYRVVERIAAVVESAAVGQRWEGDVRVVLFVKLADGQVLDEALVKQLKTEIRQNATPRHVPARIVAVPDLPRTKSGKLSEVTVRDAVNGDPIKNLAALANPESLDAIRTAEATKS
ncbi:MAG: acetoacetate--CoA ligase [Pseudomonadota bacterium]